MAWFRQWQLFARGSTTDEPGPIDNKTIAIPGDTSVPLRSVRKGSDYAQINSTLWHFFHGIYGGGPEIVLRGNPVPPPEQKSQKAAKEREIEPMEVSEPTPTIKSTTTASVNQQQQQQQQLKEHAPEVSVVEPPPSTQSAAKPQKSVSFEDNEGYHENDADHEEPARSVQLKRKQLKQQSKESKKSESDSADGMVTYLRRKQLKHQQHVAASQGASGDGAPEPLEIGSRKDRRHRTGMKSNGFFGPEGKYQTSADSTTGVIPRAESFSQPSSNGTKANYSTMTNSASATVFSNSVDDSHCANVSESSAGGHPSKSVDEIMPLLYQASITSNSLDDDVLGADESDNNDVPVITKERSHHSGRRSHHGHRSGSQQSESENSQTGERRMREIRKKLKSKDMKSKVAKAGIILDGARGKITSTVNAASDNEK